jgi:hypothetical protein
MDRTKEGQLLSDKQTARKALALSTRVVDEDTTLDTKISY